MKMKINKTWLGALALKGDDPVSYFTDDRPQKGSKDFTDDWGGATWRFVNCSNRDLFASSPEQYAPQYWGYCAWRISHGNFFDGDPEVWKVVNGKLYVNYNRDIEKTWEQDVPGFIRKADETWPVMEGQGFGQRTYRAAAHR